MLVAPQFLNDRTAWRGLWYAVRGGRGVGASQSLNVAPPMYSATSADGGTPVWFTVPGMGR